MAYHLLSTDHPVKLPFQKFVDINPAKGQQLVELSAAVN